MYSERKQVLLPFYLEVEALTVGRQGHRQGKFLEGWQPQFAGKEDLPYVPASTSTIDVLQISQQGKWLGVVASLPPAPPMAMSL